MQVLFTTHSSNLVREMPVGSLIYIDRDAADLRTIGYGCDLETGEEVEDVINEIITALGLLPNPLDKVKVLIYVEGHHDITALQKYSSLLAAEDAGVIDLANNDDVAFVLTGGSSLKYWIDNQLLSGLGKPEIHIYDSDVDYYVEKVKQLNSNGGNRKGFNTIKSEMENYLAPEAIEAAYKQNNIKIKIGGIDDSLDVPLEVAKAVHEAMSDIAWDDISEEKKDKKISNAKRILNDNAIDHMTSQHLHDYGGLEEFKVWFREIKKVVDA